MMTSRILVSTAAKKWGFVLDESGDDDDPLARAQRQRKDVKNQGSRPRTQASDNLVDYGFDEERPAFVGSAEEAEKFIGTCGDGKHSRPWLKATPWKARVRTQDQVRDYRCTFWNESGCRYKIREIRKLEVSATCVLLWPFSLHFFSSFQSSLPPCLHRLVLATNIQW